MINVTKICLYENRVDDAVGNVAHKGVVVTCSTEHRELLNVIEHFGNGLCRLDLASIDFLETILMLVRTIYFVPCPF